MDDIEESFSIHSKLNKIILDTSLSDEETKQMVLTLYDATENKNWHDDDIFDDVSAGPHFAQRMMKILDIYFDYCIKSFDRNMCVNSVTLYQYYILRTQDYPKYEDIKKNLHTLETARVVYPKYLHVNEIDGDGYAYLFNAVYGDVVTFRYLLSIGLDPNFEDKNGNSMIHIASVYMFSSAKLQAILDEWPAADYFTRNNKGNLAIDITSRSKKNLLANIMTRKMKDGIADILEDLMGDAIIDAIFANYQSMLSK